MVEAPGGVAAPEPACKPNVYGSVLVQLTEKPPPVAFAAAACSDVYANATLVTADSVHAEVSVTLTLKVPEVLPACALPVENRQSDSARAAKARCYVWCRGCKKTSLGRDVRHDAGEIFWKKRLRTQTFKVNGVKRVSRS